MHKMQFCFRVILATVLVTIAASLCVVPSAPQSCEWLQWLPALPSPGHQDSVPCCSSAGCWVCFGVYLFRQQLWLWVEFLIYRGEEMWVSFHSSVLQYHVANAYGSRKAGVKSGLLPLSKSSPSDFSTLSNVLYCFHFLLVLQQCV